MSATKSTKTVSHKGHQDHKEAQAIRRSACLQADSA